MPPKQFDASKLQSFGNAAAGQYVSMHSHIPPASFPSTIQIADFYTSDGVLSDESGAVVVKPCTAAEISFYESVSASHPDLAPHLPKTRSR
jgi:1D-myo-inositol-tetrakisphosphate 5-kinase/inositol-polyphosphate multikinase